VSLDALVYEVDAALVGKVVPSAMASAVLAGRTRCGPRGERVGDAKLVDVHANCFVKRDQPKGLRLADTQSPDVAESTTSTRPIDHFDLR
jgi:hypothetical protein